MKKKIGFVSNSSSTSFIVPKESKKDAENFRLEIFEVADLISHLKILQELYEKAEKKIDCDFPDFIRWKFYSKISYYNKLVDLEKEIPGCYISEAVDDTWASLKNIYFERFVQKL